jgi:glutathione S-transferase
VKLYVGDKNTSSWSLRPYLALARVGVPFEVEVIPLYQPDSKARLLAISPNGKVPCLHARGEVIWDSLAICETIAEWYPDARLWPSDPLARAVARSVSAEMHSGFPAIRRECSMNLHLRTTVTPCEEVRAELARFEALWGDCRSRFGRGGPFLFGEFSIADAMFAPVATRIRSYGLPVDDTTHAWMHAIFALPALREWESE